MATDTIIDDIHRIREEYAKHFNNDLKAICNDARSKQGHDGIYCAIRAMQSSEGKPPLSHVHASQGRAEAINPPL